MTQRLNNDFQFVQVGRQEPKKTGMYSRTHKFVEIYEPSNKQQEGEQRKRGLVYEVLSKQVFDKCETGQNGQ